MSKLSRDEREALSSQSACNCGARPGRLHAPECQYISDLRASQGESRAATDPR